MTLLSVSDLLSTIKDIVLKVSLWNTNYELTIFMFCFSKHRSHSNGFLNLHYTMRPCFSDQWEDCTKNIEFKTTVKKMHFVQIDFFRRTSFFDVAFQMRK